MTEYATPLDFGGGLAGVLPSFWPHTPGQSQQSEKIETESRNSTNEFIESISRQGFYDVSGAAQSPLLFRYELIMYLNLFKRRLSANTCERLQRRMLVLLDPTDWDNDDKLPDVESFRATLEFLSTNKNLHVPTLSLNRNGHFTLAWRPARDKLLSLIFEPNHEVSWLVYTPNAKMPDGIDDTAGQTTSDRAMSLVKKFGMSEWIYRPSLVANTFNAIWRRIT